MPNISSVSILHFSHLLSQSQLSLSSMENVWPVDHPTLPFSLLYMVLYWTAVALPMVQLPANLAPPPLQSEYQTDCFELSSQSRVTIHHVMGS